MKGQGDLSKLFSQNGSHIFTEDSYSHGASGLRRPLKRHAILAIEAHAMVVATIGVARLPTIATLAWISIVVEAGAVVNFQYLHGPCNSNKAIYVEAIGMVELVHVPKLTVLHGLVLFSLWFATYAMLLSLLICLGFFFE